MPRRKKHKRAEKGEGSFRYNKSGTLEYRFPYKDENDVSRRKSVTGANERECIRKADDFLEKMEKKKRCARFDATIPEILKERYQADYDMNYMGEAGYDRNLKNLQILEKSAIGNIPIVEIEKDDIKNYLSSLTHYSNSMIQKFYRQVRLAYIIAEEYGVVERNIMNSRDLRCPKSDKKDKKVRGLTPEEQKVLVDYLEANDPPFGRNDYRLQLFIELYSGMRMGEINALKEEDIDLENDVIHVRNTITRGIDYEAKLKNGTKTYNGIRDVPISSKLRPYLEEALRRMRPNPDNLIFYDYVTNTVINTSQVNDYYQRVCVKIGLPADGQHALRHTFATRCIESGVPPVVLKTWLGHKDIHTTLDTYTDVFKKMDTHSINIFDDYINKM